MNCDLICSDGDASKTMKCKVLHVLNDLGLGGTESYVVDLSNTLDKSTFESHVAFGSGGDFLRLLHKDVRTFKYSDRKASFRTIDSIKVPIKLIKYIKREKIDIVQTYIPPSCAWGWIASHVSSARCTHLIVESLTIGQVFSNLLINNRWLAKIFDLMIAKYAAMLRYSQHEYASLLGVAEDKFVFVGHGVNVDKYQVSSAYSNQIRHEFHISDNAMVLGSVGRLTREKGVDFFLKLIPKIKQEFSQFVFLVVGDGPEAGNLRNLAVDLKIHENVIFTGARFDTERIFNALDCHIFCMRRPLLGMANMQAMACGLPLVVLAPSQADKEMASEFIKTGVNGYIAEDEEEFQEAVLKILKNPSMAKQMGLNARKLIEESFNFEKHVSRMESLYLSMWKLQQQ